MAQKVHPVDNFFLDPPWRFVRGMGFFLVLSVCGLLRASEFGDADIQDACRAGLLVSGLGGAAGGWPILSSRGKSCWRLLGGALLGGGIRLLIGLAGLVIILLFTEIHRLWVLMFILAGYLVFLAADTAVVVWILSRTVSDEEQDLVQRNLWDCVGR